MAPRKPPGDSRKKNEQAKSSPEWDAIKGLGSVALGMAGINDAGERIIVRPHALGLVHPQGSFRNFDAEREAIKEKYTKIRADALQKQARPGHYEELLPEIDAAYKKELAALEEGASKVKGTIIPRAMRGLPVALGVLGAANVARNYSKAKKKERK